MDNLTAATSPADDTFTDVDIAPMTDTAARSATIETGNRPTHASDTKAISFTGADVFGALVCPLPERLGY